MGAKAPVKVKRQAPQCDICSRKFTNIQALTVHRKFLHKIMPLNPRPRPQTKKKIEFKCPKCVKVFSVYFSAYRHIQKYHCEDSKGSPVAPNSQQMIKPIRTELCLLCKSWMLPNVSHSCPVNVKDRSDLYMCLGCQQTFDGLPLFEEHVKAQHGICAEYFFFPSSAEFTTWKTDLEASAGIKYLNSNQKSNIYHCSHEPGLKMQKTLLCPSSLYVTEFNSGYKIVHYKDHFGHTCPNEASNKHKKYSISTFFKDSQSISDIGNDDNVYQHFKSIMDSISASASKVDIGVLNTLLGKALEMTIVLNSIMHDETAPVNKSMTDKQISDVLAEVKTYSNKRKSDTIKKDAKKLKPAENDENSKSNNSVSKPVNKQVKKTGELLPVTPLPRPLLQSPSFNDTYKDFVDQNFSSKSNGNSEKSISEKSKEGTPKRHTVKKKEVMKTKIGQFKVRPSLSPKKDPTKKDVPSKDVSNKDVPIKDVPIKDVPIKDVPIKDVPIKDVPIKDVPIKDVPIKDVPIKDVLPIKDVSIKDVPKKEVSKKEASKKIVPKKDTPLKSPMKIIKYRIKPDIKYEVRERENDCNILILKI